MNPRHLVLFPLALLVGCAAPPLAIDAHHPASAEAPEGGSRTPRPLRREDANTARTRQLLTQREQETKAADSASNHENH